MGESQVRSLSHNFVWAAIGNVVYALCQWGMLGFLTKTCSAEVVGQFALALAICGPVMLMANLNLRAIQATDARHQFEFGDYLGLRVVALSLACTVLFVIGISLRPSARLGMIIAMVTMTKVFDALSELVYGVAQQHERMEKVGISRILQGLLQVTAFGVTIWVTRSLLLGTVVMAVASGAVTILYDLPVGLELAGGVASSRRALLRSPLASLWTLRPRWTRGALGPLSRMALPLGIVAMAINLNMNMPKYYIDYFSGQSALGIFSSLSFIVVVIGAYVMEPVISTACPRLAVYHQRDRAAFIGLMAKIVLLSVANGVIAIVVATVWGRQILSFLYRPEYGEYPAVFTWLMVTAAIDSVAFAFFGGLAAARRFEVQLPISLALLVTSIVACSCLVPHFGLLGGAWALALGALVRLVGYAVFLIPVFLDPVATPEAVTSASVAVDL